MKADTRHSEHASAGTSASGAAPGSEHSSSESNQSEAQFLADEAAAARSAIENTIAQMRETLRDGADYRAWTERYPWAAVGVSAAAGFLVASTLIPKRRGREREEEAEPALLERILADERIAERIKEIASEEEQRPRRNSGLLQSVGSTLLKTFGPALQSAISTALAARAAAPSPEEVADAAQQGAAEANAADGGYRQPEE